MGNPHLRKRGGKKSNSFCPSAGQLNGREMTNLPVPLTTPDGGPSQEPTSLATSLRRQFPHVLLIECMLEKMCATYETDPAKQKELFKALRTYFVAFRLLPPQEGFPEMDLVRLRLGADLNNLFRLAKLQMTTASNQPPSAISPLAVTTSPFSGSVWSSGDGSEHLFTSRYELDFKELEFIASGGFGVVYKARNILDNNEYAIKKIVIGPRSASKIIREVQLLSLLHHPNIVAYKSAWLEYCSPHTLHDIVHHMEDASFSSQGGASAVHKLTSFSREYETVVTRTLESNHSDSVVFESETVTESSLTTHQEEELTTRMRSSGGRSLVLSHHWRSSNRVFNSSALLLYIQMQLCPQTLRQWLNKRNQARPHVDEIEAELSIFRQIVQGLDYIHGCNIIHRDIKPENIFVHETTHQVQIGDFGLAKLGFSNIEPNSTVLSTTVHPVLAHPHTRGVGTHSYAAPEQLSSKESDAKSDIYSLGIVLLELLIPFQTDMERYKSIERLRNRSSLPDSLHNKWPGLATLMLEMISPDRVCRPSATDILSRLAAWSEEEKSTEEDSSAASVPELLSIIRDLRRQLSEKNLLIRQLMDQKQST